MLQGTMKDEVGLACFPGMVIKAGQRVRLIPATNIPRKNKGYYASPLDGKWADGMEHSEDDSILVDADDVTIG